MKAFVFLLIFLCCFTAKAHDNIVYLNIGTQTLSDSGSKSYTTATNETGTISWDQKLNTTILTVNYLRRLENNVYLGLAVGNNESTSVLMGFGF